MVGRPIFGRLIDDQPVLARFGDKSCAARVLEGDFQENLWGTTVKCKFEAKSHQAASE